MHNMYIRMDVRKNFLVRFNSKKETFVKIVLLLILALLLAACDSSHNSKMSASASTSFAPQARVMTVSSDIICRRDDYDPEWQ